MNKVLSEKQMIPYERDGFLSPLSALSVAEVSKFRSALEDLEVRMGGKVLPKEVVQPHLHFQWAYELSTHPNILDAVEDILGPNILVHTTSVFCKYPGVDAYIAWHQDGYYWGLSHPRLVSAWIALNDSTVKNGCMQVLLGTHGQSLPHTSIRRKGKMLALGLTDETEIDESCAMNVTLKAGKMSLHHVNLVHRSQSNRSNDKRIGFAIRYIAPEVSQTLKHHAVVLARGQDNYHHYELMEKLPPGNIEEGLVAQAELARQVIEVRREQGIQV